MARGEWKQEAPLFATVSGSVNPATYTSASLVEPKWAGNAD